MKTILQIVPRAPGEIDGVGDYALALADKMRATYQTETVFAVPWLPSLAKKLAFEVLEFDRSFVTSAGARFDRLILQYVNYGYQKRGVPFELLSKLKDLRAQNRARLLTVFHELYASGPPWRSSFWLKPVQKGIARSIARMSEQCIVSSEAMRSQLSKLVREATVSIHPVPSAFGEPALNAGDIISRDPRRWVICGGNALLERSLRSLLAVIDRVPEWCAPKQLSVVGGRESATIRALIGDFNNVETNYVPNIFAADASQILGQSCFAWLNYFHHPRVPTDIILKSSTFAAICAHAVIPVLPHPGSTISVDSERLPGPFYISADSYQLPTVNERSSVATGHYEWYRRHASSDCLVRGIAQAFALTAS